VTISKSEGKSHGMIGESLEYYPWLRAQAGLHLRQCSTSLPLSQGCNFTGDEIVCCHCGMVLADGVTDRKSRQAVGIVGFGAFGRFLAKHLSNAFHGVAVTDVQRPRHEVVADSYQWTETEDVARCQTVILAVPLQNLEGVLKQISSHLRPDALVVDVCSVKQVPIKLMLDHLPASVEILGTHPLFGPQSAKTGLAGHRIAICPARISSSRALEAHALLADGFGLKVIETEAETHDREMASVQALMHFIARGLAECGIRRSEMSTMAFDNLCDAAELLGSDSWELFKTIEIGNPFAAEARARFVEALSLLEKRITDASQNPDSSG
jgi:prephenate dehydrogenase